jgi:glyoxylase-like metal-dependent hydrolase (beta-lactamase superfamily II)
MFGLNLDDPPEPDVLISEKIELSLGNSNLKFLFTPGHTPGEFCIYLKGEKICVTGDVLFKEGIGRTDLWGGDYNTLIKSIETKLFTLPDNVKIFPGHGESSTIKHEKENNPFLN